MKPTRTVTALALVLALGGLAACNNNNTNVPPSSMGRFQLVLGPVDYFLVDTATGDVWKADESTDPASWARYANGPTEFRALDAAGIPEPPPEPEQEDQQEDKPEGEEGG